MKNSTKVISHFLFILLCFCNSAWGVKYVVFRYDDFAADLPEVRQQDPGRQEIWAAEKRMDAVFRKYAAPYHLAIIPNRYDDNRKMYIPFTGDPEKIDLVKRGLADNLIEVSQHGYSHELHTPDGFRAAEFRQRTLQQQQRDLLAGKKILEQALSVEISIFVPPWNGWDEITGNILTGAGFTIFSSDRYYDYKSIKLMKNIPFTVVISELENVDFDRIPDQTIITALFHPLDFSTDRIDALLKKIMLRSDVRVTTLSELVKKYKLDFSLYKDAHQEWLVNNYLSPLFFTRQAFYYPTSNKQSNDHGNRIAAYSLNFTAVLVGLFGAAYVKRKYGCRTLYRLLWPLSLMAAIWGGKVLHILYKGFHLNIIHVIPLLVMCSIITMTLLFALGDVKSCEEPNCKL
ncbi:MAG: DUF2334 domain-containing protein [Desulfobulbus sp.]|nr:DUF2334 domain-containing protein [Desulfobulbus sp.]